MNWTVCLKAGMIGLFCLGLLVPAPVLQAAETSNLQQTASAFIPPVVDVALSDGGTLRGQAVDSQGIPLAETAVALSQFERQMATTTTDKTGRFTVTGLRGGTYQIVAGRSRGIYRLWAADTAPPSARDAVLVTENLGQVRGQFGGLLMLNPITGWVLAHPWWAGGLAGAAIAVPVLVNDRQPESP